MALINKNHSLVFWDASAFIAVLYVRDKYHQQAKRIQNKLEAQKFPIFTTDAVLTELANTFAGTSVRQAVTEFIGDVHGDAALGGAMLIHVDKDLWGHGWELYSSHSDKSWGHTDCVSFIVMRRYGIQRAFTADKHFEQAGFTRLMTEDED